MGRPFPIPLRIAITKATSANTNVINGTIVFLSLSGHADASDGLALRDGRRGHDIEDQATERRPHFSDLFAEKVSDAGKQHVLLYHLPGFNVRIQDASCRALDHVS